MIRLMMQDSEKGGKVTTRPGRPATIGNLILSKALFNRTVADIVRETGAKPDTVRSVLRRASDRGEVVIKRFYKGKQSKSMVVRQR